MPCPHNEITIVQRSQRQSAVAAAAYQSGEKLFCEYDQQVKHYGRMIEIYLLTSLAPIPVATLSNRELGNTGQNYLKSLFAVGFQGLLILVCVAIYAVLIQGIATGGDPIGAIWGCMGYSVLLCFCLFKTGSIARSVFSAH